MEGIGVTFILLFLLTAPGPWGDAATVASTSTVCTELGQRLQAEDDDGDEDDQDGDDGDAPGGPRALRVLEEKPHLALEGLGGQRLLVHATLGQAALILAEGRQGLVPQLVEADLLQEDVQRHVDRPAQPAPGLVVVEDGVEAGPVAVEEVLVPQRVEVAHAFLRVAQQRVGELRQSLELRLEAQPGDVDDHALAAFVVVVLGRPRVAAVLRVAWGSRSLVHILSRHHRHGGGGGRQRWWPEAGGGGPGRGGEGRGRWDGWRTHAPSPPALQRRGFRAGRWRLSATWLLETRPSTPPAPQFGIPLACRSGAAFPGGKGRVGVSSCSEVP